MTENLIDCRDHGASILGAAGILIGKGMVAKANSQRSEQPHHGVPWHLSL
jgi:hypothetical protein